MERHRMPREAAILPFVYAQMTLVMHHYIFVASTGAGSIGYIPFLPRGVRPEYPSSTPRVPLGYIPFLPAGSGPLLPAEPSAHHKQPMVDSVTLN